MVTSARMMWPFSPGHTAESSDMWGVVRSRRGGESFAEGECGRDW